jgi:hypothetical protein
MSASSLRRPARAALLGMLLVFLLGSVATATNVVPATKIDSVPTVRPMANQLKPSACAGVNLNGIFVGSGIVTDNNQPHLVLGSPGIDIMRGGAGDDCILGGGGIDTLRGDGGQDVCIGGPGLDIFFNSCEVEIQ